MKKRIIMLGFIILMSISIYSQNVLTTSRGEITFFSSAPLEDIKATNNRVNAVLNVETGEVLVRLLISNFQFRKSLMQKHFNENYMESDKYPQAEFSGQIVNFDADELTGQKTFQVTGKLTIRNISQPLTTEITMQQVKRELKAETNFPVKLEDHDVRIPRIMMRNIAEIVDVTLNIQLQ